MMNKRSSRLIAMLLALVMIFNIVPTAALADGITPSNEKDSAGLQKEDGYPIVGAIATDPVSPSSRARASKIASVFLIVFLSFFLFSPSHGTGNNASMPDGESYPFTAPMVTPDTK